MIIPDKDPENSTELSLSSSVVAVGKDNTVSVLTVILNDRAMTFTKNKQVAVFQFLSQQDEEELIEIGSELLALNKKKKGKVLREINQLMRVGETRAGKQPKRTPPEYDKIWFPTPKNCQNPDNLHTVQREIFLNVAELQKRDFSDAQNNEHDKKTSIAQFDWSHSALSRDQI